MSNGPPAGDEEPENEWDEIVCLPIIDVRNGDLCPDKNDQNEFEEFVTAIQLVNHIQSVELPDIEIVRTKQSSSWLMVERIFRYLAFWQRKPNVDQQMEANKIMMLSNRPFENGNKFHLRCLYTIFAKLTGNVVGGFRRFGHHWEEIGFQGSDPATDFRGVGILGLFQLTFFAVEPDVSERCREIYEFSTDSVQHYPFAVTSMNLTQLALQMLRNGSFDHFVSHHRSVLDVFNQFYFGTFMMFHDIWKRDQKTIMDIGYVLKDLKQFAKNNPKKILNRASQTSNTTSEQPSSNANGVNFTNIMFHPENRQE